jgi:hypothetical protein
MEYGNLDLIQIDLPLVMDELVRRIEALEEKHAIKVLLLLREKGELDRTSLYRELDKGPVIGIKRVDRLVEEKLLIETIQPVKPFAHFITLSPKGQKVADKLAEIEEILEDTQ